MYFLELFPNKGGWGGARLSCLSDHLNCLLSFFIGPESDHWFCLSLTDSLTDSVTFRNLIDVTLTCEDANSKLVEVVTVADVDAYKYVDNSLVQIWKLKFGHKIKFLSRL